MTTFLLVPGLFMGGWAWAAVAAELTAQGHRALPVTLPGMAERAGEDPARVGLGEHTDAVAALLDAEGPGIVLVAHSYGIFPALAAADRRPGQVSRVVFVDTGFPEPGESVVAQMPQLGLLDRAVGGVIPVPEEIPAVHAVPPHGAGALPPPGHPAPGPVRHRPDRADRRLAQAPDHRGVLPRERPQPGVRPLSARHRPAAVRQACRARSHLLRTGHRPLPDALHPGGAGRRPGARGGRRGPRPV